MNSKNEGITIKELKIMSAVGDELPVEKDMSNWYPIVSGIYRFSRSYLPWK